MTFCGFTVFPQGTPFKETVYPFCHDFERKKRVEISTMRNYHPIYDLNYSLQNHTRT